MCFDGTKKAMKVTKRKSDRLRTLKTCEIIGPRKHANNPFVILEEYISVGSVRGKKTWNNTQKSLTQ